jgi:4-hydroxybenzoate polyprenyltransferase
MPGRLSQHLLAVLQFTRMAMVFTAISNAQAAILLRAASMAGPDGHYLDFLSLRVMFWAALVSSALYGFGMSLNDIIDRRRDAQLAADRPLPSGRLGLGSAHVLCMMLLAVAGLAGVMLSRELPRGTLTLILVAGVSCLIIVYDVAGKYLISLGLLSLGLIRFFHAAIPAPTLPMPWHPLLLLNHVAILSMVAYQWEQKRPTLTPRHFAITLAGLAALNATIIAALGYRFADRPGDWLSDLALRPGLLAPTRIQPPRRRQNADARRPAVAHRLRRRVRRRVRRLEGVAPHRAAVATFLCFRPAHARRATTHRTVSKTRLHETGLTGIDFPERCRIFWFVHTSL